MRILVVVGKLLFTVTSILAVRCEGKVVSGYEESGNCKLIECAPYQVVLSRDEFEIRRYEDASWVSTPPINSNSYGDAMRKGFGMAKTSKGPNWTMTAPVLADIYPSTGPCCNSSFVVHFNVPKKYQPNPPLSDQVHSVRLPRRHTYAAVKRFGGFVDDSNIPAQVSALDKSLKAAKETTPTY